MTSPAPGANAPQVTVIEQELEDWIKQAKGRPLSLDEVFDRVALEAGLDDDDLTRVPVYDRYDIGNVRWSRGASPPGDAQNQYMVVAIFVGDQADRNGDHVLGEVRVYSMPRTPKDPAGHELPFYRYVMGQKPGDRSVRAQMGLRFFIDELSHELNRLAVVFDVLDDEEPETDEEETGDPRVDFVTSVTVVTSAGQTLAGVSSDISQGGMCARGISAPIGSDLKVTFALAGRIVTLDATMCWANGSLSGMEFDDVPDDVSEAIGLLIKTPPPVAS